MLQKRNRYLFFDIFSCEPNYSFIDWRYKLKHIYSLRTMIEFTFKIIYTQIVLLSVAGI